MRPDLDIAGCTASHARLQATIDGLTDADVRAPSLLPDWSIGHVLTHVARNADSHVRMLEGAARGEVVWQYGPDQREREIEEGAGRPAAAIVADVRAANAALEAAWAALADDVWATGLTRVLAGEVPVALQPLRRWREIEFHHADLGLGFTYDDFDATYVGREEADVAPPRWGGRTDRGA
jgi:maleylpyruvate isomerase